MTTLAPAAAAARAIASPIPLLPPVTTTVLCRRSGAVMSAALEVRRAFLLERGDAFLRVGRGVGHRLEVPLVLDAVLQRHRVRSPEVQLPGQKGTVLLDLRVVEDFLVAVDGRPRLPCGDRRS